MIVHLGSVFPLLIEKATAEVVRLHDNLLLFNFLEGNPVMSCSSEWLESTGTGGGRGFESHQGS